MADPTRFFCDNCQSVCFCALEFDPNSARRECAECGWVGWVQVPSDEAARRAAIDGVAPAIDSVRVRWTVERARFNIRWTRIWLAAWDAYACRRGIKNARKRERIAERLSVAMERRARSLAVAGALVGGGK